MQAVLSVQFHPYRTLKQTQYSVSSLSYWRVRERPNTDTSEFSTQLHPPARYQEMNSGSGRLNDNLREL